MGTMVALAYAEQAGHIVVSDDMGYLAMGTDLAISGAATGAYVYAKVSPKGEEASEDDRENFRR